MVNFIIRKMSENSSRFLVVVVMAVVLRLMGVKLGGAVVVLSALISCCSITERPVLFGQRHDWRWLAF